MAYRGLLGRGVPAIAIRIAGGIARLDRETHAHLALAAGAQVQLSYHPHVVSRPQETDGPAQAPFLLPTEEEI